MLGRTDLARLVQEAGPALAGSVFHRSWLADGDTWVVLFQKPDQTRLALEMGLEPEIARLCAVPPQEAAKSGKDDAHFFLTALRKYLGEKKLEGISHVAGDRIAVLDFGDLKLVVELTGRASNLIITKRDDEVVLTLRPGRPQRPLDPGSKWAPPPPRESPEEVFRPELAPDPVTLALSRAVLEEARRLETERDALDHRTALLRAAQNGEKRVRGLVAKLEKERDEAQQAEKLRQQGELLKANVGKIKKGQTRVTVVDFFSEDQKEVELELDPLEPVMDQARALFKRAKKLDRGIVSIETIPRSSFFARLKRARACGPSSRLSPRRTPSHSTGSTRSSRSSATRRACRSLPRPRRSRRTSRAGPGSSSRGTASRSSSEGRTPRTTSSRSARRGGTTSSSTSAASRART